MKSKIISTLLGAVVLAAGTALFWKRRSRQKIGSEGLQ